MNLKYTGNYLGMVIANNDPEKRGRIKVWVPHVSATVYDNWNNDINDKNFKFLGDDTNPDLNKIIGTLKDVLPWAECAAPLFGGSASGRYNAMMNKGTTSDSNYWNPGFIEGNRPVQNYIGPNAYPDAFAETGKNKNKFVNPYAYQYTPSDYTNMARGMFTIPNVGAHVWVFFLAGEPNAPVYFAVSYGQEDWQKIYSTSQNNEEFKSVDYPNSYENIGAREGGQYDSDTKTFRSKTVLNSNKHVIELVDTDLREILKMTHFSGSFKEFNNYANIELATNNDQKMVIGDQFYTVQKNQSMYIGMSQDVIIAGDQYLHIGLAQHKDVDDIVKTLKDIHEFKKLFDIQRTLANIAPNDVSSWQTKLGTHAVCPICGGMPYIPAFGSLLGPYELEYVEDAWTGTPRMYNFIQAATLEFIPSEFIALIGVPGIYKGFKCKTCGGTCISPSTQDGIFNSDPYKAKGGALDIAITSNALKLAELERKLDGGDQLITITKNKVENIGLIMNDMKSFRTDPIGKLKVNGIYVALEDSYTTYKPSPHVEYVDVDDIPGGDYNLTVGNKYKLLVGAKGISMKTFGPIDIYGTIVNMTGEQVNISSQNEVLIDGGERFSIRARKVSLIPFEHNPVVIDGQLHVTRNVVIGGGLFAEGEVGLLHLTAPYQYNYTELGPPEPVQVTTMPDGQMYITPHRHVFKQIASTLLPSKEAVRDYMRTGYNASINSTTKILSDSLVTGDVQGVISDLIDEATGLPIELIQLPTVNGQEITGDSPEAAGEMPRIVWKTADAYARKLQPTVGYVSTTVQPGLNRSTYNLKYNYSSHGQQNLGLTVSVVYNNSCDSCSEEEKIISITHHYN